MVTEPAEPTETDEAAETNLPDWCPIGSWPSNREPQDSWEELLWAMRHTRPENWRGLPRNLSAPHLDEHGYHIDHPSRPLKQDASLMHPDGYTLDPPGYTWDGNVWRGPTGELIE